MKKKHLYIFIERGGIDNDRVLEYGEGKSAIEAHRNMIKNNPEYEGIGAIAWRLADDAEAIPLYPGAKKIKEKSYTRKCIACDKKYVVRDRLARQKFHSPRCAMEFRRQELRRKLKGRK